MLGLHSKNKTMEINNLYTIGYGNRTLENFISLLQKYDIKILVDVRTTPFSRFRPQFNKLSIMRTLLDKNIQYVHKGAELGGKPAETENVIYEVYNIYQEKRKSIQYLQGISFLEQGLEMGCKIAIMCCELDYKNCHRYSLVGEDISNRGWGVLHIDKNGELVNHKGLF
jgi:uncharacterized protein (DUF488 family)